VKKMPYASTLETLNKPPLPTSGEGWGGESLAESNTRIPLLASPTGGGGINQHFPNHAVRIHLAVGLLMLALAASTQVQAADDATAATKRAEAAPIASSTTVMGPPLSVVVNKSTILRLEAPATRISVANPAVADITPINSREIYVLGKSIGSTNLIIWNKAGVATMMDVRVTPEPVPHTPAPAPEERDSVEVIKGLNKSKMEF